MRGLCENCIHQEVCDFYRQEGADGFTMNCPFHEEDRPRGEWVWKKDKDSLRTYDLLCSKCGYKIFTCENFDSIEQAQKTVDDLVKDGKKMPNYCYICGSDNRKKSPCDHCIDDSDCDRCDVPLERR